ncbi:hypothetical protein AB1N83_013213 [Pleurotus pulmonarius]
MGRQEGGPSSTSAREQRGRRQQPEGSINLLHNRGLMTMNSCFEDTRKGLQRDTEDLREECLGHTQSPSRLSASPAVYSHIVEPCALITTPRSFPCPIDDHSIHIVTSSRRVLANTRFDREQEFAIPSTTDSVARRCVHGRT